MFYLTSLLSANAQETFRINLLDSSSFLKNDRVIIFLKNDKFIVASTYNLFISSCEKIIKAYNIDWDKDLVALFASNKSDTVYTDTLMQCNMNTTRLTFRLADLLENGECLIYNKKHHRLEKQILTKQYATEIIRGRIFFTKNNLQILTTIDAIE